MLALISVCSDSKDWHGHEDIVLLEIFNNRQPYSEDVSFNLQKMKSDNLNFKSNQVRTFTGLEKNTRTAERKLYSSSRIVIELLQI